MAKLDRDHQKQTEEAKTGFDPIVGIVHAQLKDVDPENSGDKGPYWVWEFEVVEPGEYHGRKLWNNVSLSKEAAGLLKQNYEAFGVPLDTDTDDMIGMVVRLQCNTRTIQKGDRKGEPGQNIARVLPKDEDFELPEAEEKENIF